MKVTNEGRVTSAIKQNEFDGVDEGMGVISHGAGCGIDGGYFDTDGKPVGNGFTGAISLGDCTGP